MFECNLDRRQRADRSVQGHAERIVHQRIARD